MAVLILAKHDNKTLIDATAKAVTAAKAMGGDITVLVAGQDCAARRGRRRRSSTASRRSSTSRARPMATGWPSR